MTLNPAREKLLAQHEKIRQHLATAERFAAQPLAAEFLEAVIALADELAEHNRAEEALLIPLLRDRDSWSAQRIQRMIEEHTAEHATVRAALIDVPPEALFASFPDLAEELRAHLEAEERTFLHIHVLSSDR